ncbi:hypothetical protein D3C81_2120890 [compost metagenome]
MVLFQNKRHRRILTVHFCLERNAVYLAFAPINAPALLLHLRDQAPSNNLILYQTSAVCSEIVPDKLPAPVR